MAVPDLRSIQLVKGFFLECAIINDEADPVLKLGTLKFRLGHKVSPAFSTEDNEILIDLSINCQPLDEQTGALLPVSGRFRLHLVFRVLDLEQYLEPQEDGPQPSQELILTLISVAYSTARGLIASKTADTVLREFVLPLLDVRDMVKPS